LRREHFIEKLYVKVVKEFSKGNLDSYLKDKMGRKNVQCLLQKLSLEQ
jgi:hypothetical protein